ncbi:MAG: right-handed parallel beta-helix repeat-containing protein, partial [Planctomycetota bacterium]
LIEENIFDRNGWDHRIGRSDATIFAHNVYIQRSCNDVVFRGNISMRASSHGVQLRPGGIADNNVFIENPMSLLFANARQTEARPTDSVRNNVILNGVDLRPDQPRGWGIHIQDVLQVTVEGNIVANSDVPGRGWGFSVSGRSDDFVRGTVVRNNVVRGYGDALFINPDLAQDVLLDGNTFVAGPGSRVGFLRHDRVGGLRFGLGNVYGGSGSRAFELGSRGLSVPAFINEFDPAGSAIDAAGSESDIDTYARSIGLTDRDAFYAALRSQRRGAWDERLTARAIYGWFAAEAGR